MKPAIIHLTAVLVGGGLFRITVRQFPDTKPAQASRLMCVLLARLSLLGYKSFRVNVGRRKRELVLYPEQSGVTHRRNIDALARWILERLTASSGEEASPPAS